MVNGMCEESGNRNVIVNESAVFVMVIGMMGAGLGLELVDGGLKFGYNQYKLDPLILSWSGLSSSS